MTKFMVDMDKVCKTCDRASPYDLCPLCFQGKLDELDTLHERYDALQAENERLKRVNNLLRQI